MSAVRAILVDVFAVPVSAEVRIVLYVYVFPLLSSVLMNRPVLVCSMRKTVDDAWRG